jgi:hypothetical protein
VREILDSLLQWYYHLERSFEHLPEDVRNAGLKRWIEMLGRASGPVRRQGIEGLVQLIEEGRVEEEAEARGYNMEDDD